MTKEAEEDYLLAIAYEPNNSKARKELGYKKKIWKMEKIYRKNQNKL